MEQIKDILAKGVIGTSTPDGQYIDQCQRYNAQLDKQVARQGIDHTYHRIFYHNYVHYQACSLEDFGSLGVKVTKYLNQGHGLYIHGGVGVGKTHMALGCLKRHLSEQGRMGLIYTGPEILDRLRHFIANKDDDGLRAQIRDYVTIDMLVIDDFGVQATTAWADEQLEEVINKRWLQKDKLVTIVTSNYSLEELEARAKDEVVGARIVSRLAGMCKVVEIKGKDRRLQQRVQAPEQFR